MNMLIKKTYAKICTSLTSSQIWRNKAWAVAFLLNLADNMQYVV